MAKISMGKTKKLDSDDIIKRADKAMKEIIVERNKIRAELGEPLIEA